MPDAVARAAPRVKVGATLDPDLVAAVDRYVVDHPGTDRSGVLDSRGRLNRDYPQAQAVIRTQGRGDPRRVGLTYVEGVLTGPSGEPVPLKLLIDTGASYSLLPYDVWQRLGLAPKRRMTFHLADGTPVERMISECHIRFEDREGHTPVILGEPGDVALLGVVTLENLGLVFNPFDRSLRPMTSAPLMPLTA